MLFRDVFVVTFFNGLPCVGTFTQFLGCPLNTSSTLVAKIVLRILPFAFSS